MAAPSERKLQALRILHHEFVCRGGRKIIIFSEFLATQDWAVRELEQFSGDKVAVLNGALTSEQKADAITFFEREADILVSTEAGAEGFNLQQQCHLIVNLDLPWNPMRIDQRVGRADPIGQTHRVCVVNVVTRAPLGGYDDYVLMRNRRRAKIIAGDMCNASDELGDGYVDRLVGQPIKLGDVEKLLLEAAGRTERRTAERINAAVGRARGRRHETPMT